MAATQSLSLLHISPSYSSFGYWNSHTSSFFTPTVRLFIGVQLSIQPLSYRSKPSRRYSSIVATVSSTAATPFDSHSLHYFLRHPGEGRIRVALIRIG
ncbi:hypothetical protein HanRHA438_Chr07g0293451 [Helianthus annuus]|uniref:Uncharacterized protein n=1 Tax=Helianthus annuus TaxID=4232 RepID=A0A9K3IIQ5_HELAN|nr:hypothetical protein HanXRQr2_Chr07g0282891 [Helianthus annuus]KAJ0549341.1 hypothetical protein HanHA300_Chr07g0232481 [Helianthus annuus]KAJ0555673.1 hypothetical protein HanIR_Chr07g0304801 [Helianthus annuus]KAJ0562294.1 hypothetical protein HanHA89_Chr07g0249641 [Helianthus annuus]KAJ0730468.1 hypothetical protein HanOQP8_Chr07g0240351 [Helianthus annuus]